MIAGYSARARRLFLSGKVEGLFGWSTMNGLMSRGYSAGTLVDLINESGRSIADFRVLWESAPIANGPHAVLSKLPEQVKKLITKSLMQMYEENPAAYDVIENYRSGGFATAKLANYQTLIDLVNHDVGKKKTSVAD